MQYLLLDQTPYCLAANKVCVCVCVCVCVFLYSTYVSLLYRYWHLKNYLQIFLKPLDICATTEPATEAPISDFYEPIDRPITSLFISLFVILLIMLIVSRAESVSLP